MIAGSAEAWGRGRAIAMDESRLNQRYEARLRTLSKTRPQYIPPEKANPNDASWVSRGNFAELGALSAAVGQFRRAREWFGLGLRANLEGFRSARGKVSSWPRFSREKDSGEISYTIPGAVLFGQLSARAPGGAAWANELREGLPWMVEDTKEEIALFLSLEPSAKLVGKANSAANRLWFKQFLPALVLGDEGMVESCQKRALEFADWFRRTGASAGELDNRGFVCAREIAVFDALVRKDPHGFVDALKRTTGLFDLAGDEEYLSVCHYEYLSLYLLAWERMGPLPKEEIVGIPPGFDPEAYWSA